MKRFKAREIFLLGKGGGDRMAWRATTVVRNNSNNTPSFQVLPTNILKIFDCNILKLF